MFKHSDSVPKAMRPIFNEVVAITDAFCTEHLTRSYADLARNMAAALSRKRPSSICAVTRYVLRLGKIKTAMSFLNLLQQVEPDHHITKIVEEMVDRHTPKQIPPDAKRFLYGR